MGSDVVKISEDFQPPDPEYWEEIMPQFDMDDAISEADLIVEEVCCNMIKIENHDEDLQEDNKNSLHIDGQEYSIDAHSNEEFTTLEMGINHDQKSISIPLYISGRSLSASMITYASDEEPNIFSFESADSLNSELLDVEIQSLCEKINETKVKVSFAKDTGHKNLILLKEDESQPESCEMDMLGQTTSDESLHSLVIIDDDGTQKKGGLLMMVIDVESLKLMQFEGVDATDLVFINNTFHTDHSLMMSDQMGSHLDDTGDLVCTSNVPGISYCRGMCVSNNPL